MKRLGEENINLKNQIQALKESEQDQKIQLTKLENQTADFLEKIKNLKKEIQAFKDVVSFNNKYIRFEVFWVFQITSESIINTKRLCNIHLLFIFRLL